MERSRQNICRQAVIEALETRNLLAFAHPSILSTQADFDRMVTKVSAGAQPWSAGFNALAADGFSQSGWSPRPLQTLIRGGTGQNFNQMVIDMQRAYQTAVRWKISGNTVYADQSVAILNAWSSTMTSLTGNADRFLASGLYGFGWAEAADIMRSYTGWASTDVTSFQNYLVNIYVPMQRQFLTSHNDAYITNYWANWDLANVEGMMAIGIFADRQDLYDEAMNYLKTGGGNGSLDKMVYFMHPGNLAQWQESGRDQGHTVLGMQLFGHIAQMAWQQGDDLFAYNNYQFLAAAEYVAKFNLGNDVPYQTYNWGNGQSGAWSTQPGISWASRGDMDVGYELIYGHYHDQLGMATPYSQQRIAARGTEWRGSGDDFGFGTLTFRQEPVTTGLVPKLTAREKGNSAIELNWYGTSNATGYNVYRSTSANGNYSKIASNITDLLTYNDFNLSAGTYYYKVTGIITSGETGDSNVVSATSTSLLNTQLNFNEVSGTTATDATGNNHVGTLNGGATWATGKTGNAVLLNGTNGFVSLPTGIVSGMNDFTISSWVYLNSAATWSRVFDFGDSRGRWMMLTPRNSGGVVEFATSTVYGYNKQWVTGTSAMPINQWVHVAVTLGNRVGKLFVNGVLVGSNPNMDFAPFQFASTSNNWIGRSQYASDPYLNGKVDDFRISRGAMKSSEIYNLATGQSAPAVLISPATLTATPIISNQINLSWSAVSGTTAGYTVWRSTTNGGPYTAIATQLTSTTYSNTSLPAGTTYYYVVTAANNGGDSAYSVQASATVLPPLPSVPANVVAKPISSSSALITWDTASDAATYTIKRSSTPGGPYTSIATGITALAYTSTGLSVGTAYYFVVIAVNASGSAASSEVSATPSDQIVRLKFDDASGTTASDSTGNNYTAALNNGPIWTTGKITGAVHLDGTDDYVSLPTGVLVGINAVTLAAWVYLDNNNSQWTRIFDFGSGTPTSLFLTPKNGSNNFLRFAIKYNNGAEQQINTTYTFPVGQWVHVAVTMDGATTNGKGYLYVNGTQVGSNTSLTLNPNSLGSTTQNYLGKSQYADPYLPGSIDDFRIYSKALSATEITQLYGSTIPAVINGTSNADTYLVKRTGSTIQIFTNALGIGSPAYSGDLAFTDGISISAADGNDTLIVDYSYGDPTPTGGITIDTGLGTDSIIVKGSGGADTFAINSTGQIAHGVARLTFTNSESLAFFAGIFSVNTNLSGLNLQVSGNTTQTTFTRSQSLNSLTIDTGATVTCDSADADLPAIEIVNVFINNATLSIAQNGSLSGVSKFSNLAINGTGRLDLQNNDLIIDFGNSTSPYETIRNYLKNGMELLGGDGNGIGSSDVDTQSTAGTVLAVIDNSTIDGGITSLSDFTDFSSNSILIKFTWFGDSNFDGQVDGQDYALLDTGYTSGGALSGWIFGDYDYDGSIDDADYSLIDTGYIAQNCIL